MAYNLIAEQWIPARRASGGVEFIAPWQVTDGHDTDPFVATNFPRPDFDGAAAQFLIGLMQAAMPPDNPPDWGRKLLQPPAPEELRERMETLAHAFNLDGDGPRFMQDKAVLKDDKSIRYSIRSLLIDAPQEGTIDNAMDHFIKGGTVHGLCFPCSAAALFTLQTNAPGGGRGNMGSLRGIGPLTTIVMGENLWETIWNNVLRSQDLEGFGCEMSLKTDDGKFPWMGPIRTSEGNKFTFPQDVHPLQMYWSMPRRIALIHGESGQCDLCRKQVGVLARDFLSRPYGVNYKQFRHPLSPNSWNNDGEPEVVRGTPAGLAYKQWLGLAYSTPDAGDGVSPARVVRQYRDERLPMVKKVGALTGGDEPDFRLWAFGYEMERGKPMKARRWNEGVMPVLDIADELRPAFADGTSALIEAAREVAWNLRNCLKKALVHKSHEAKGTPTLFEAADAAFWENTRSDFVDAQFGLRKCLETGKDTVDLNRQWLTTLANAASQLFQSRIEGAPFSSADPKRVAVAFNDLRKWNSTGNRKFQKILGIPAPEKKTAKQRKEAS